MSKPKHATSEEVIENYTPCIQEWLKYAYSEGYGAGYDRADEHI